MKSKKLVLLFAVLGMLGFYLIGKVLNNISLDNAKHTYVTHCGGCHGENGEGLGELIPPLANADWLDANRADLACIIRYGIKDSIKVNGIWYDQEMIGLDFLSDIQIANLVNYINSSWGNKYPYLPVDSVNQVLKKCN